MQCPLDTKYIDSIKIGSENCHTIFTPKAVEMLDGISRVNCMEISPTSIAMYSFFTREIYTNFLCFCLNSCTWVPPAYNNSYFSQTLYFEPHSQWREPGQIAKVERIATSTPRRYTIIICLRCRLSSCFPIVYFIFTYIFGSLNGKWKLSFSRNIKRKIIKKTKITLMVCHLQ